MAERCAESGSRGSGAFGFIAAEFGLLPVSGGFPGPAFGPVLGSGALFGFVIVFGLEAFLGGGALLGLGALSAPPLGDFPLVAEFEFGLLFSDAKAAPPKGQAIRTRLKQAMKLSRFTPTPKGQDILTQR